MSTICADELLHVPGDRREARAGHRAPARRRPAITGLPDADRVRTPGRRARYEDFEVRASHLGDLLGGQVFPRTF